MHRMHKSFIPPRNADRFTGSKNAEKSIERDSNHSRFDLSGVNITNTVQNTFQPKLKINQPGDKYEQEADRIANQIMRMSTPQVQRKCRTCEEEDEEIQMKPLQSQITPFIQRKCAECDEEEELQMKAISPERREASSALATEISQTKGHGRPVDSETLRSMSYLLGRNLSDVRVRTGARAARMNREINARAFTVGKDIYFNQGQYAPHTTEGRRLLAHEVVHTVQQGKAHIRKIQRSFGGFFSNLWRAFAIGDEPDFDEETIDEYLQVLAENRIEDDFDSDNKARYVVQEWKKGEMELSLNLKIMLIREMLSGYLSNADEQRILDLLEGSTDELNQIFSAVSPDQLVEVFDGDELDRLRNLMGEEAQEITCNSDQSAQINNALPVARQMLDEAIAALGDESNRPFVNNTLWLMFRSSSNATFENVSAKIRGIRERFSQMIFSCIDESEESTCSYAPAYVQNHTNPIYMCTNKMDDYDNNREYAELIIHEASHLFFESVIDHGYYGEQCRDTLAADVNVRENDERSESEQRRERSTEGDPTSERLNNADSYSCLVNLLTNPAQGQNQDSYRQQIEARVETEQGQNFEILRQNSMTESLEGDVVDLNADTVIDPQAFDFEIQNIPTVSGITFQWNFYKGNGFDDVIELDSEGMTASLSDHIEMIRTENINQGTIECVVSFQLIRGEERETRAVRRPLRFIVSSSLGETIQPKLKFNRLENKHEKEADQVADSISLNGYLSSRNGSGQVMDQHTNRFMSSKLGVDLSNVRIHSDSKAAQMSESINAKAFTHGNDIYFNRGEYNPQSKDGQQLLAHELVHTVQQESLGFKIQRQFSFSPPAVNSHELITLISCLTELNDDMERATSRYLRVACQDGNHLTSASNVKYIPEDRADAFGHCWIACQGTKNCGEQGTAFLGIGREYFREAMAYITLGLWGHNSFTEDVHNQDVGRALAINDPDADTFDQCYQAITNGDLLFHGEHTSDDDERPRVYNCEDITLDEQLYEAGWRSIPMEFLERF